MQKNQLEVLNAEIGLRRKNGEDVEDLADRQTDAITAVIQAERNLTLSIADNNKTRSELVQDRLERDLDILIDGFDNQKTINERIIGSDRETLSARQSLFDETVKLSQDSFDKQIETIQKFTGARVNANDLLNESDAVALNNRIRELGLSEIIEGRLLEVIRDRRIAVQDLSEVQQVLNDATDQQKIVDIETEKSNALTQLFNDTTKTAEQIAVEQNRIEFEAQKKILETQLSSAKINVDERAKLEEDLANIQLEKRQEVSDKLLSDALKLIELERIQRTKAILESSATEEQKAKSIRQAEIEATEKTIETKIQLETLGVLERQELELQLIQNREKAAIESENRIVEKRKQSLSEFENASNQTFSIIGGFDEARTNKELSQLERTYERRLDLAEGNADETARLEEELAQRRIEIEEAAFERQKQFAKAQAIINGALAITKILAETPKFDFGVATAIQIALAAATTASQLAAINAQTFHTGGIVDDKITPSASKPLKKNEVFAKLEKKEMIVTADASSDNKVYRLEGTKAQIVSAINASSGGEDFAKGGSFLSTAAPPVDTSTIPSASVPIFGQVGQLTAVQKNNIVNQALNRQDLKEAFREALEDVSIEISATRLQSELDKTARLRNNARG